MSRKLRLWMAVGIGIGLGAPVGAWAQEVDVNGAGNYTTFAAAQAAASAGDTLTISGILNEAVVVSKDDLVIEGAQGAILRSNAPNVITVQANLALTIRDLRIERVGTGTRGITVDSGVELTILDSTFNTGNPGATGGGIQASDSAARIALTRVTFEGATGSDRASNGGALYVAGATGPVTLTDVTFTRIEASGNGGAIYSSNSELTCTRCRFERTAGGTGGAVYSAGSGSVTLVNSLACGSSVAGGDGGAVFGTSGGAIRSSRFVGGTASDGSALRLDGGTWTIENNAFLDNAGTSAINARTSTYAFRNNLFHANGSTFDIEFAASPTVTAISYNWFGGAAVARISGISLSDNTNDTSGDDPVLAAWSDNGNCDDDLLYPAFDSPLIDAGAPTILDPDQSRSDIGAYGGPDAEPSVHLDGDGDGTSFVKDCNDGNAAMYTGNTEICDTYDNDCNGDVDDDDEDVQGQDLWHPDCDNDGQGDMFTHVEACFAPTPTCAGPWMSQAQLGEPSYSDCNDADPLTYLGAPETCEPGDQNCDGNDDVGATDGRAYYMDADGDGYGDDLTLLCDFSAPPGYVLVGGDCNDDPAQDGASFHPGAADYCGDSFDQDCNGGDGDDASIVYWYPDADADGFGNGQVAPLVDCLDPSAPGDAYVADASDCDDTRAEVNPEGVEVCNLLDDDCDGGFDNLGNPVVWYPDSDEDGFGDTTGPLTTDCPPASDFPWTQTAGDCDDDEPLVHPNAAEICNDVDDDCDDELDAADEELTDGVPAYQDRDLDGYGACPDGGDDCAPFAVCPDDLGKGSAEALGDCDDTNPAQNPGRIEVPGNQVDEDCDGLIDPGRDPEVPDQRGCNCGTSPSLAGGLPALALLTLLRRRRQR